MKAVSEFVIHLSDLFEAEGRSLRQNVRTEGKHLRIAAATFFQGLSYLVLSVPLILAGLGLLATAAVWVLQIWIGWPAAAGAVGLVLLALGLACLRSFNRLREDS